MALLLQLLQTNLLLATLSTSFSKFFFASFQILLFLQTVKNDLLQYYHQISKQNISPYLCFAIYIYIYMQISSDVEANNFSMCSVN
jgi:hypothetical protein